MRSWPRERVDHFILSRLETPIVLVLDDLHEVTDDQVMSDLAMLLRAPPPGLRLLIATRRDPAGVVVDGLFATVKE